MLSTSGFEKSQIQFGNMYWSYINFLRSGLGIWFCFLYGDITTNGKKQCYRNNSSIVIGAEKRIVGGCSRFCYRQNSKPLILWSSTYNNYLCDLVNSRITLTLELKRYYHLKSETVIDIETLNRENFRIPCSISGMIEMIRPIWKV